MSTVPTVYASLSTKWALDMMEQWISLIIVPTKNFDTQVKFSKESFLIVLASRKEKKKAKIEEEWFPNFLRRRMGVFIAQLHTCSLDSIAATLYFVHHLQFLFLFPLQFYKSRQLGPGLFRLRWANWLLPFDTRLLGRLFELVRNTLYGSKTFTF